MRKLIVEHDEAAPVDPLSVVRLRHRHASLLLRDRVPVHVIAARLGRLDPAITLRA